MKFHTDGTTPTEPGVIFVFGSNLAGRHGAGAAKVASKQFGAAYGHGVGRTGMSYGIPTKDQHLQVLAFDKVKQHIADFLVYARANPNLQFFVTRIGCGLALYQDHDVAPLFADAPDNCSFAEKWHYWIRKP